MPSPLESPAGSAPGPVPTWRSWQGRIAGALAIAVVTARLAPHLRIGPIEAFSVGFAMICGLALWVGQSSPAGGAPGAGLTVLSALVLVAQYRGWIMGEVGGAEIGPWLVLVGLLTSTTYVGGLLGSRIEHPGHLLFVGWVSSLADIASVYHHAGITHAVAESVAVLSVVALPFPMLGTSDIVPFLGGGDLVFLAMYFAVARNHGLSGTRMFAGLTLGLTATLVSLVVVQAVVPALPFLAAGVMVLVPEARRPPRAQRTPALVFAIFMSLFVVALLTVG